MRSEFDGIGHASRPDRAELLRWNAGVGRARMAYAEETAAGTPPAEPESRPCRECGAESIPGRRLCDFHRRLEQAQRARDKRAAMKGDQ